MIDQYSIIVEPKYQVSICKDILRDFSKKSVLEPQVKFIKQSLIQQIEKIDEKQDESINILRRIFDKECEKIINLEDFALNFAVQEKLEQIWQQQSTRFIEQMKENYKNRQEAEFNLLNLLNFIYLIIKRHNSSGQSCNFFLYLWKQTPLSPSIFDVFIYCDDWELSYRIIQILQDIKFEEAIKFQIKPSIVQQSFEQQIHMGFYLFTNIVIAMTSQNHFHHKNRYNSLVEYKYDEVILFKKRGSSSFLVTNLQNLNLGQGDIIYKFDISSQNNEKRNQSLWDHFLQTIGEQTYLESNKSQKQIEIFEAFIEFKYAVLCKENFNQAAYFQIFYRRLASFASSNKLSILKNFCLQYMKREIHFNYIQRQNISQFSLYLIKDIIQKLEKKGWIYRNGEEVQQDEVQQLKKDQLFRLAWDIILYENGNILHYLQEQYKIESDLFGKIEDFIFQYYLNTKNNAFIYTYEDMQFPNGANIDTSSGFFQLFFQQFKNCYEKIIFSNDNCPVKKKLHDYDNSITVWQIQMLTNVLNQPETFQGKQGIISQIQYNELIRRYNDQFRITITDLFKDIFIMILDRCLDTQNNNQLTDIFIHRFVINCSSLISDQKKLEIIQLKGVQYFDQLFQQILTCKNRHAAFTFLMLLEHSSEVLRNQIIEFIVTSKQTPLFQPVLIEEDKQNPQMNSSQSQDIEEKSEKDPQVEQEDVEQIRKNIILSVAESLIKDYGFCYDIFMNLSKTDPFSLNCKQDLEKNNKIYNLYVKYYPQIYLNKGTVMMHTQFFNQPGIKLQLRNQLLKSGVLQAIVEKIEMDYELELNYYINNIKKENLICKQTYKTMLNAKYTFLIHNTKQYIDTTMTLCNNNATPSEKKEIKEEILKHSFLLLRLLLSLNNLFTYGLSTSLSYLSNIRVTVLRFVEIITSNTSEDVDFNPLLQILFRGLENQKSKSNQSSSCISLDKVVNEFSYGNYMLNKQRIQQLFQNFTLVSNFYFDQEGFLSRIQNSAEAQLVNEARNIETISFILKKIIKQLSDSSKKQLITKYFQRYHLNNINNCYQIAASVQRKYVKELFKLKLDDILIQRNLHYFLEENSRKQALINFINDEEQLKIFYKRTKCFLNVTRFGLSIDVHGACAEQMQAFVFIRDSIIQSFNYVFFGSVDAPKIFKKQKQTLQQEQQIKQQKDDNFAINNSQRNNKKNRNGNKQDKGKNGLILFLKSKSTTFNQKIVINQFVCMKYFNPLQKMMHFHLQSQFNAKSKKKVLYIESNSFINSIIHLFKNSLYHIQQCKEAFAKNQSQQPNFITGGAGGGGSSNINIGYLDVNLYSKKSCLAMSSFVQLIFQEFSVFLMHRFSGRDQSQENVQTKKEKPDEKTPLLEDTRQLVESVENVFSGQRRNINNNQLIFQDDNQFDDTTLSQLSSESMIDIFEEEISTLGEEDINLEEIIQINQDNNQLDYFSKSFESEQSIDDDDEFLESEENNPINKNSNQENSTQNSPENLNSDQNSLNSQTINHDSKNVDVIDQISAERPNSQNQNDQEQQIQQDALKNINQSQKDDDAEQIELEEQIYADKLEYEINQNKKFSQNGDFDQFQQKQEQFYLQDKNQHNSNLMENENQTLKNSLEISKAEHIKQRETLKKQKYEIYFIKLKYLLSIILNNLQQIETCDVSAIMIKIQEKQIGLKIDRLKAIQFFEILFDSIEQFDLYEAISFKQFMNNFYHPTFKDDLKIDSKHEQIKVQDNQKSENKSNSPRKNPKESECQVEFSELQNEIAEQINQNEKATIAQQKSNEIIDLEINKKQQEEDEKKKEQQFASIIQKINEKIKKNKLMFLDITVLNSNQSEKIIQNCKTVLNYIQDELIPEIQNINKTIQENIEFLKSSDQNQQQSIQNAIQDRKCKIINIIITLSVISYYLQFQLIKESEEKKIKQTFKIMSRSISIFQYCQDQVNSENFYLNESVYLQNQCQKKISLVQQNLAQRFMQLSFQLILVQREQSIKLFIHYNILQIARDIKISQVEVFRNNLSLVIYSIIYEIFNTPYNYCNNIEFSIKNHILTCSKSNYQKFQFSEKYAQPLDLNSYYNEAKQLIMKGPKNFMKAFYQIMSFDKQKKQKLKCLIKKKYRNKWCYPIKLDENQQKVIYQLFEICQNNEMEGQIYEGMAKQQDTLAGSNNYLVDEIETNCMNNFCFGKIILNLLQYYPCLVEFGQKIPEYQKILIDFMLQDSMGATKRLVKLYFTIYSLYHNNLNLIDDYWNLYINYIDQSISDWLVSTKNLQKLFQQLHMIDLLQETSAHLKFEQGLQYMKRFLQNILTKLWDGKQLSNNQCQKQDDLYYFQNYLNIPSLFAVFYKNYLKNCLYNLGFDDIFNQTQIYDYLKELKYCLQMTSMQNYIPALNNIFKQQNNQSNNNSTQNLIEKTTNQVQEQQVESNRQDTNLNNLSISQMDNIHQINLDQNRIDEIQLVSQEFPFALEDQDRTQEAQQEQLNEQMLTCCQQESEDQEPISMQQQSSQNNLQNGLDSQSNNKLQESFNEFSKQQQIIKRQDDEKENLQKCDISELTNMQSSSENDLFEGLKELQYGLKIDGAAIPTNYVFQVGIKYCGIVENKFCNQQSLSQFMGRDIQVIINDSSQYIMTNTYYKTKWKNSYNQFPLSQQNLQASLQKYFQKIPTENTKFSLLKEVNKIALFKYQQIQLKIQNQKGKDFIENKQLFKILSNKRNNNKQIHSGLDIDKNEQTAIKKLLAEEKKQSILDDSPKSNSQSKQQASDKKSSSKFKSYEAFKDQELSSDEEEKEKEDGLLTEIYENNKEIIINYYTNKLANDEQQKEQLQEVIQKHIQEVKKLLRPVKASEIRNKILTVIAKYFYYDVSYICQRIKETLANNSFTFVKELFEYFAPFNNDIFLQNEVTSLQKVSESNAQIVKTFITLFNQLFPGQNLLNVLPIKDDSTNHLKILIQGKEYPFLQNRNPYTIEKASKNKFDKKIADIIVDQTKKINQYNQKVKQQLQQNKTKVDTSISTKQLINQFLSPTSIKEEDSLINYQTINIYSVMNNQKSEIKLRKSYFDIIFGEQFQDLLIEFPNQIIEVSLTMQEQLCCEEDYLATIQSSSDQYEFLLIFFQHPENRKYLMKQMKLKMEILQNNKQKQFEENNQNKSSVYNLQDLGEQNNQLQFNSYQRKNYSFEELKTMLQNRYLLFLNLLISNNEGIYELFLDSGDDFSIQTKETDNIQRYKENEFISVDSKINRNYKDEKQSSMIQNFIREMGKSEYTIKSIQHQKTIKSNYKLFVTFYTLWFDRSFLYFKESFEPFFDEQTLKKRESSINKFILNQDFIKVYTAMLLNDLNSTNYKAKINFHIEKIMINLNKEIIFSLIKEISNVIVEQIEPVVNKLLECIKRIYKQMKSDLGNNPQNLEKIDNNDRDVYYNSFQQQSSKYVDNLHSKCDKQFYLIKYMNNLFKIMIEQKVQSEFPVQFKQQIINNIFDCKPKLNEFNTEERKIFNDIQQHLTHTNEEPIIDDNIQSNKQINQEQSHLNAPLQNVIQFQEFENEPIDLLKKNNTFNNQILSNKEYISADNYYQRLLECLRNYEESIKEKYEEILLDSGCFNLYSQILIFSKYYSISLQAGLIYNDRQSKYFSNYSYFSKSYQSLFYLYKIIHSNHYSQVDSIIKGSKDLDDVEECFDFPSDSSIDQNEFLLTLQRQSLSRTSDLPKEVDLADEERKDKNTQLHHNYNYADHIYQTVSSVSLQEKEENTSSLLQNHHLNIQNNSDKKEQFGNQEHYSNKLIKTAHNLEEGFDDEDFLGLNSISLQELNLSNAVRYHELFKFFIRLENVIYFCIVRTPQDFAKIITQPLKDIQNRYSLHLKKMLIVSQTKFRVKKNINNNYTSNSSITIDRTKMVEESIPAVMTIKSEQLCLNTLYVKWKYESGIDEGGPRREWFSLIFNQLLDPNFGLFVQSKKNYTYMPNPFSFLVPDHLIYFKFLGILLGKAFLENYPVQANFAKPFLKLFLKKKIVISDIEEIDPELYKNLNWLLKNQINADEIDINFAYDKFYAGQKYEIELKKNGRNMQVCNQNKKEYVKSICHAKLIREIYYQAHAITSGFKEIVCEDLLQILDEQMLSFIFSGNPEISIPELKETIQLQGYTKNDKQIKWLFEILESFNNYEKSCFIFFITGSMNLPHGGFKQFPITITLTQKVERLPVSHTCANSIDLPNYPTKERLEDALRKALFECQGFELA
ncbi:ATP-dependent metalloprotease FtsH family protein (macronuclear) [Tetrahymena thermophila SB210]|uniref:HECT-type E3 ubiquitin transferase n=1 Tax=Tetrahymena thermophila (strain SB210) TaxID=312017 RepID=A4VDG4_TETTS|nr:ATP-dependent metalloprotease FtsH family protein [Tetrahymena thermophila SB210]EDK31553.2 ATP-dependent metalloprotease FtsH family protein [Tetrahymena thermophila SB210]|eukprot:XP_001470867.2 ATP-dependent metalloprotease FtsH family protein [Tetrahymena thermophila SB210]